jgi:MOSC domain-containing protein YiiM
MSEKEKNLGAVPGDYSFHGFALPAKEGIFAEVIESGHIAGGDTIVVRLPHEKWRVHQV